MVRRNPKKKKSLSPKPLVRHHHGLTSILATFFALVTVFVVLFRSKSVRNARASSRTTSSDGQGRAVGGIRLVGAINGDGGVVRASCSSPVVGQPVVPCTRSVRSRWWQFPDSVQLRSLAKCWAARRFCPFLFSFCNKYFFAYFMLPARITLRQNTNHRGAKGHQKRLQI